ncbi:transcription-repair-coupling factor [Vulcanimicrobium alpinum]|uniref:Transcription-repair-coupling factor n=1 Tax=Vulcanimicrobium alpinum TaxID=3016050 RepID=A0AAN1XZ98_UNVUL|nr:transcription-repair coupling factor [Vulcanimicrobium alpinum]BDE07689.1 transcription-repair-coupling factor [Vulcanimicrobium alpinum]
MAAIAPNLVRALPASSRSLAELIERLRTPLSERGLAFALHETTGAARPFLLAGLHEALGGSVFVVVPTSDVAERTFTDLTYYLGEKAAVALLRPRDENLGALESPSERSARMSLLADLCARKPQVVVAPVAALRQYVIPRAVFEGASFTLRADETAGWEATQQRLYRLGYARVDVVSAAGQYAVRGGILDVFPATADAPVRIEFFGDDVDAVRAFELQSQRSTGELDDVTITPWLEVLRDDALRENVVARATGESNVISALRAFLGAHNDVPEPWLSLAYDERATVLDYLDSDALVVLDEPGMLETVERGLDEERARGADVLLAGVDSGELDVRDDEIGEALLADVVAPHPTLHGDGARLHERRVLVVTGGIEAGELGWLPKTLEGFVLETRPAEHFNRRIERFAQSVREWVAAGETVWLVASGASRLAEILRGANVSVERSAPFVHLRSHVGTDGIAMSASGVARAGTVYVDQGSIEHGFAIPGLHLHVLGDREIYGQPARRVKLRAVKEGVPVTLADLKVGDYVVHAVHGIGQYLGLRTETILGATSDYLDLKYAGTDRMLVPVHQMHQVTKYTAAEGHAPRLSKMGGGDWARTKSRVSEKLAEIAEGLVQLYAEREIARGHAFAPDTPWQAELEEAFPYEPTPDQAKAIAEAKADMESPRPMDRLVCGDVGYGKTEVAVRAIFKAIADRKQVAVLCPTTLLAAQHARTIAARFASFPVRIEELSRFKTKKEAQAILDDLAQGKVDVVIGTHRILQKDVVFRDLGLIVVDEEQRFGVMHKERLKQLKATVDVLTLSATPIPRTLQMSLMGVRDLSLIQTAPKNRMSIKTVVVPASDAVVQRAIANELDRGGQVYYVHNRIESIYGIARALEQLVPKARVAVGHGQMREHELEPVMEAFINGEIDVFVSTTIIENGIDIPNVNTIVVNDADKFGLAQLYQLRGRVGRSNHQAYAFLLYQAHKALTEEAKARLEAIREFTHLGSGLQIAMRDLEIRGSGNLLGAAQSGFIGAVGFETYAQLLADAIAERKGVEHAREDAREAVIDVKLDAYVPDDYVPQISQKIAIYQQLAAAGTLAAVEAAAESVRDRFGAPPPEFEALVEITRLRVMALRAGVTRVVINEQRLTLGVGTGFRLDPASIPKLQSLTKNKFRFGEGKITIDLPARSPADQLPTLRALLGSL